MSSTYLYAVLAGEHELDLGRIGLPDGKARVGTVRGDELSVLVSEYEGLALSTLSRVDRLRCLILHQQVLERVPSAYRLLPVKFGTFLTSTDDVRRATRCFRGRLQAAIEEFGDAVEIDLSAAWDLDKLFGELSREPAIVTLSHAAAEQTPEESERRRVQVGELVEEMLEERREEYRRRVVNTLVPLVRDAQPNPLPSNEVVLNIAFLVGRSELAAFDATLDQLGAELEGQLTFRYVGPLPPYNFATVELTRPDPAKIASACTLLGLDESTTEMEVRSRYRELAAAQHPDQNPEDSGSPERFAALTAAQAELVAYLHGVNADGPGASVEERYDLREQTVKEALCLDIIRGDTQLDPQQDLRHGFGTNS